MITGITTRERWTRRLAALLLVLQGLAGGAVSLAHASERLSAPIHIEAQHASSCVILHDELRCALCHYAGARVVLQQARPAPPAPRYSRPGHARVVSVGPGEAARLSGPPRAPPLPLLQ